MKPLLASWGLLEEFCNTAFALPDDAAIQNNFEALFASNAHTAKLHQSVLEHCCVSHFHVLRQKVIDIASDMGWSEDAQLTFEFCDVLTSVEEFHSTNTAEPFPNFPTCLSELCGGIEAI